MEIFIRIWFGFPVYFVHKFFIRGMFRAGTYGFALSMSSAFGRWLKDIKQYENFEKLTGIKVNVIKAGDDELLERLKNEGQNSPADLFVTVDAGKLQKGVEMGLFQKIQNETIDSNVSDDLKDINGYWIPITYRARLLVYSNERVKKSELSTYEDLANDKWKGRLLVRSSSNAYNQALMSSPVSYTHLTLPTSDLV